MKNVSIPHRYGKNKVNESWGYGFVFVFPFLIGTVRTKHSSVELSDFLSLFPFLIGTVRTKLTTSVYPSAGSFHSS